MQVRSLDRFSLFILLCLHSVLRAPSVVFVFAPVPRFVPQVPGSNASYV
jgi:hypothetical protein